MNENAQKWVAALRERNMQQTKGVLHEVTDEGDKFCCLGVACKLYIEEMPGALSVVRDAGDTHEGRPFVRYNDTGHVLPAQVQRWLGLQTDTGAFSPRNSMDRSSLGALNDHGADFRQIADIIESEPSGLFVEAS